MASSSSSMPSFFSMKARGACIKRNNIQRRWQLIKVQYYQDEGRFTNMVDENINVLKKRIEMVKVKERLERCCTCQQGWNYVQLSDHHKTKRNKEGQFMIMSLIELMGIVCRTLGLTCFGGTLFIYLLSLLVHHLQS